MIAQFTRGDNKKAAGYILHYEDPKYYEQVNEIPPISFSREVKSKLSYRRPTVTAIFPRKKGEDVAFNHITCCIANNGGKVQIKGYDDESSFMVLNLEKYKKDNQLLLHQSEESERKDLQLPVFHVDNRKGRLQVQWVDMNDENVPAASMYVAQLCLTVVRKTAMLIEELKGESCLEMPLPKWKNITTSYENLFWLYLPFPRPRSLYSWIEKLEASPNVTVPWFEIGPRIEGFYLVSLHLTSESEGQLTFVESDRPQMSITVEVGSREEENALHSKDFSNRARVSSPIQLAVSWKGAPIWNSLSWGSHSDQQRLRLLPFSSEVDIAKFGHVCTRYIEEGKLTEWGQKRSKDHLEIYEKIMNEAKAVYAYGEKLLSMEVKGN